MKEVEFINERRGKRRKKLPPLMSETELKTIKRGNAYQYTKTGFRSDLGMVARSNWEANFARILTRYNIPWEFEPEVFPFPIKRGVKSYLPDFYLPNTDEFVELKGWLDPKSKTKLKRFKKYYPDHFSNFVVVLNKTSRDARSFCELLGVPTILTYQDFQAAFKNQIGKNWEG